MFPEISPPPEDKPSKAGSDPDSAANQPDCSGNPLGSLIPGSNVVCLMVDRVHVGYLGPYGNTWIQTPNFDRLAWQAVVFDQCWIESPQIGPFCRACWTGRHPWEKREPNSTLGQLFQERGWRTVLLSDDPAVIADPLAAGFAEQVLVEVSFPDTPATSLEQTYLAGVFTRVLERLERLESPFFVWIHLRGLGHVWDAPLAWREQYADEGDPPAYAGVSVPDCSFTKEDDPDLWLSILQAYAGQMTVLDGCVEALLDWWGTWQQAGRTTLIFGGVSGLPLGEHGWIGPARSQLYSELVHVPLMLCPPPLQSRAWRVLGLVEPVDLFPTILEMAGIPEVRSSRVAASLLPLIREEKQAVRQLLCLEGFSGERALRTPAWFFRLVDPPELFVKPYDFWDFNNVAVRCQEIVERLTELAEQAHRQMEAGTWDKNLPLDESLTTIPE